MNYLRYPPPHVMAHFNLLKLIIKYVDYWTISVEYEWCGTTTDSITMDEDDFPEYLTALYGCHKQMLYEECQKLLEEKVKGN